MKMKMVEHSEQQLLNQKRKLMLCLWLLLLLVLHQIQKLQYYHQMVHSQMDLSSWQHQM
jgi:hypothetical protein